VPLGVSNGWIAYSTDGPLPGSTDLTTGSDLYLVREGGPARLIAGRDGGAIRNACPSFSPDGTRLAYGVVSDRGRAIVIRGVKAAGTTEQLMRIAVAGGGPPVCVRWSSDGSRLAYLDGGSEVVRGIDGSTVTPGPGDPDVRDLATDHHPGEPLRSPSGDWIARVQGTCELVVARPDGTDAHVISLTYCPYAIAGWSPDGTRLLLMVDVSGMDFSMHELAIDTGVDSLVVASVRTNGQRSWAGSGDVSWQPVLP
jgi:Tol biopolymer transport system component